MKKISYLTACMAVLFIQPAISLRAGEHPEHPQQPDLSARNESSGRAANQASSASSQATLADISTGIKKHIAAETKQSADHKAHIKHQGKDLALDLVKVHEERLSSLGGGKYFACVDLKAADGTVYDVDYFLAGQPKNMKVTETSVHKINGKALYNWQEQKDHTWKKVAANA